jgi:hypothetical protein
MTNRKVAAEVYKRTHPFQWVSSKGVVRSPRVVVNGTAVRVEIRSGFFPLVTVVPGGTFRCFNPWGWPHSLLSVARIEHLRRQETRHRLLQLGLEAQRKRKAKRLDK